MSVEPQLWEVVGGSDKGGILVREGLATTSPQLGARLSTGAVVEELQLSGERLRFRRRSGDGPQEGWVSIRVGQRDLCIRRDGASPLPEAARGAAAGCGGAGAAEVEPQDRGPANAAAVPFAEEEKARRDDFARPEGPPQQRFSGVLPAIPRSAGLPTVDDIPEKRASKFEDRVRRPQIRLFCFYGVADNFVEWLSFVTGAPDWAEVAVYECRAHGVRESEPWDETMAERAGDAWKVCRPAFQDHVRGGPAESAPFALMSHSSGSQLMTLLATRLRVELYLEPAAVFVCDRPPPDVPAISQAGYDMLLKGDHVRFFDHFSPSMLTFHNKGNPVSDAIYERWRRGMLLTQGHQAQEGSHVYQCQVHVFVAMVPFERDKLAAKGARGGMSPEELQIFKKRCLVTQSAKESAADWDLAQYGRWRRWSATGKCELQRVMCDHSATRFHPEVQKTIWAELARIKDGSQSR